MGWIVFQKLLLKLVAENLPVFSLLQFCTSSTALRAACDGDDFWETLAKREFGNDVATSYFVNLTEDFFTTPKPWKERYQELKLAAQANANFVKTAGKSVKKIPTIFAYSKWRGQDFRNITIPMTTNFCMADLSNTTINTKSFLGQTCHMPHGCRPHLGVSSRRNRRGQPSRRGHGEKRHVCKLHPLAGRERERLFLGHAESAMKRASWNRFHICPF